ncbi:MAG: toprim domain-containing protein [Deltaproteobacteria bacterium]|nr:toprim domain-containing protein [Deltaproteobacteria bacterium]
MSEQVKSALELTQDFLDFAQSRGMTITDPIFNGNFQRFQGKSGDSGWYIGSSLVNSRGYCFLCVNFGDWVDGSHYTFTPTMKMSREDRKEIKFLTEKAREENEKQKEKARAEAARKAAQMFSSLPDALTHTYLENKKVRAHGLKRCGESLMIPMRTVTGEITGAQFIDADGEKRFITGQQTMGAMFILGNLDDASEAFLCEGYATGATIFEHIKTPAVCAFSANNLPLVAKALKSAYPKVIFRVAGDDDWMTEGNSGETKAIEASRSLGTRAIFPVFQKKDGKSTTDFNDLFVREGAEALKRAINGAGDAATYSSLGTGGEYHYFLSWINNTVLRFRSFSPDNILQLMDLDQLERLCPDDKGGVNWNHAKALVISESLRRGTFSPRKIRGVGTWKDGDSVVVNTGNNLVVNGNIRRMTAFDSRFTYVTSQNSFSISDNPLSVDECGNLLDAVGLFAWESQDSVALLAGWIAIARIAGALPIRPHVWITAGEGGGKSTLFEGIIMKALGGDEGFLAAQGQTTAAGIRQTLKGDSLPVIYDEFETEANNSIQKGVIELIRQSWSMSRAKIYKGTSDGTAMDFDPQFCALVSSIKVHLENAQDQGRFSVLELNRHNSDPQQAARIADVCKKMTPEYGHRLFARSIARVDIILKSYETFKRVITEMGHTSRLADQVGMLLAGYYSLISDNAPDGGRARDICLKLDLFTEPELTNTERDEELCLQHLLSTKVRYTIDSNDGTSIRESSVSSLIGGTAEEQKQLENFGMRIKIYDGGVVYLAVANSHTELARIFQNSHWKNWNHSLRRIPGAKKRKTAFMNGRNVLSVYLPLEKIICVEKTVTLAPEQSGTVESWVTKYQAEYADAKFPPGTELQVVRNIFNCYDMERDERIGFSRQLQRNPELLVVKLGGRYRTISPADIESSLKII